MDKIKFKIVDTSLKPYYTPYFYGEFYDPSDNEYFDDLLSLDEILDYNLQLCVSFHEPMYISLYDNFFETFNLSIDITSIEYFGLLLQVEDMWFEDIWISDCSNKKELNQKEIIKEENPKLELLEEKLEEIKEKYEKKYLNK